MALILDDRARASKEPSPFRARERCSLRRYKKVSDGGGGDGTVTAIIGEEGLVLGVGLDIIL